LWSLDLDFQGMFYIVKVFENSYKIGITSKNGVVERYRNPIPKQSIIMNEKTEDINHAFMMEQILKRRYNKNIKKSDYGQYGWTEVLNNINIDILIKECRELISDKQITLDEFNRVFKK